jgi:hypothetical protein
MGLEKTKKLKLRCEKYKVTILSTSRDAVRLLHLVRGELYYKSLLFPKKSMGESLHPP